jgi:hypothetical protein
MAAKTSHRVTVSPATPEFGVSARSLLEWPLLQQTHLPCPSCGELVELPRTLKQDVRALAATLGGEEAKVAFTIHHPADIPVVTPGDTSDDPVRNAKALDAWRKRKGRKPS